MLRDEHVAEGHGRNIGDEVPSLLEVGKHNLERLEQVQWLRGHGAQLQREHRVTPEEQKVRRVTDGSVDGHSVCQRSPPPPPPPSLCCFFLTWGLSSLSKSPRHPPQGYYHPHRLHMNTLASRRPWKLVLPRSLSPNLFSNAHTIRATPLISQHSLTPRHWRRTRLRLECPSAQPSSGSAVRWCPPLQPQGLR